MHVKQMTDWMKLYHDLILTPDEKSSYQEQREGADEFREEGGEGGDDVQDAEDEHH